jgi:hypothetical protein
MLTYINRNYTFNLNMKQILIILTILMSLITSTYAIELNSCQNITSFGSYTLGQDLTFSGSGTCIDVQANDVSLNCDDYSLTGSGSGTGININGVQNVSVKYCVILDFDSGFVINNSSDNLINGMELDSDFGFSLINSTNNNFDNIDIDNVDTGFSLINSSNNNFEGINFDTYSTGIKFNDSDSNFFKNLYFEDIGVSSWNAYFINSSNNVFTLSYLQTKNKVFSPGDSVNIWTYQIDGINYGNYWDDLVCFSYESIGGSLKCTSPNEYDISYGGESDTAPLVKFSATGGGEILDLIDGHRTLNFNETIWNMGINMDDDETEYLLDQTWLSYDKYFGSEYSQELYFENGKFNYHKLNNMNQSKKGIYYNSSESFAKYELDFSQSLNLSYFYNYEDIKEEIIGTPLTLLGSQYVILNIENDNDSLDSLLLGDSINKISLGETESYSLSIENNTINVSLVVVTEDKVIISVKGIYYILYDYDTIEAENYYFTLSESLDSSRDSVKGYASFIVSEKIIELNDENKYVKVNGYEFNKTNNLTNYVITSDFSDTINWNIKINYSVKTESVLLENESLEDLVFNSFTLSYDGIKDVNYTEFEIFTTRDEVAFNGYLHDGNLIPSEFTLATDTTLNSQIYLGSTYERIYFQGSDLNGITSLINSNSLDAINYSNGYLVELNISAITTDVEGNMFFSRIYEDEFYLYEITVIDRDYLELDFEDLTNEFQNYNGIDIDEVQSELVLNSNVIYNISETLVINTSLLGTPELLLKNDLVMNFLNTESNNFTSMSSDVFLNFSYGVDIDMDEEVSFASDSFIISLSRADDFYDNIRLYVQNNNFVFHNGIFNDSDLDSYVDHYGTELIIDTSDRDYISISIPDREVEAKVNLNLGEFDSIKLKGDLDNKLNDSFLLKDTKTNNPWLLFCIQNCTLDSFDIYVKEYNLSNPFIDMDISENVTQVSSNFIEINFDKTTLVGFHNVMLNINLSNGSTQVINETYFENYKFNIYPINNTILSDQELFVNVSFIYEPISEHYPLDDELNFLFYSKKLNQTFFRDISLDFNGSGIYNFSFLGLVNDYWPELGFYSTSSFFVDDTVGNNVFNFTVSENQPEITFISILNNSIINSSNRGVNTSIEFDSEIYKVTYKNLNTNRVYSTFNNFNSNIWNFSLISKYGENFIELIFENRYGINNTYILNYTLSLDLNGSISDFDGDGINDSLDTVVGGIRNIYTNINNFTLEINNSENISKVFNYEINVSFLRENKTLIKFKNNFATRNLDLTSLIVKDDKTENESKVLISGLDIGSDTKTIFIELFGDIIKYNSLCIKDAEIDDFEDISSDCAGADETYVGSIPSTIGSYVVSYTDVTNKTVQVDGLSHSGVSQTCTEGWSYGDWSSCSGGVQTRSATDSNSCGSINTREVVSQSCSSGSDDSSSGSTGSGGGTYDISPDENITLLNTSSVPSADTSSSVPVVDSEAPNDLENSNSDGGISVNQDLDGNSGFEVESGLDIDTGSGDGVGNSINFNYYIIGAILIIIIVSSIILIKMNSSNTSSNDVYYANTKLYVQQYKLKFTKEQIVEELREYKYPEAIIQKVISEEYN